MIIQTLAQLESFFSELEGPLAVDTETNGRSPQSGNVACGYSFAYRHKDGKVRSCYVPLRHVIGGGKASLFDLCQETWINLPVPDVNRIVKKILEDKRIKKILHHAKFDIQVFWNEDMDIKNFDDTMIMSNVIDSRNPNGLKSLMKIRLGEEHTEQKDVFQYLGYHGIDKGEGYQHLPIDICGEYAARDTDATLRLYEVLLPELDPVKDIYNIEIRIVKVIGKMERRGMPADKEFLTSTFHRLQRAATAIKQRAWQLAGREFDIGSSSEVANLLFGEFKIPIPPPRPGGTPTDKASLEKVEHPIARLITGYRQLTKLTSTYFGPMAEMVGKDGCIHCSFQQVKMQMEGVGGEDEGMGGTGTGRLACSSPNLTNVPTRKRVYKKGKAKFVDQTLVRRAFKVPGPEWQFLLVDFSQIELRVLAHLSEDPTLLAAYNKDPNDDIHKITAARIFGEQWVAANDAERDKLRALGKTVNFGVVYGIGADLLAADLDLIKKFGGKKGVEMARDFLNTYFQTYPGVKDLDQQAKAQLKQYGYVETAYGRRRYLRPQDEYKALNTLVQGTAADMNKIALYQVEAVLAGYESTLRNDIHDEVTILHKKSEPIIPLVVGAMQDFPGMRVPIVAEASAAYPDWGKKKKLGEKKKAA